MRSASPLLAAVSLCACSPRGETVETFAADRPAAEAAVAACDAGRRTRACDAAREGLVEARRRDRETLYRRAQ